MVQLLDDCGQATPEFAGLRFMARWSSCVCSAAEVLPTVGPKRPWSDSLTVMLLIFEGETRQSQARFLRRCAQVEVELPPWPQRRFDCRATRIARDVDQVPRMEFMNAASENVGLFSQSIEPHPPGRPHLTEILPKCGEALRSSWRIQSAYVSPEPLTTVQVRMRTV